MKPNLSVFLDSTAVVREAAFCDVSHMSSKHTAMCHVVEDCFAIRFRVDVVANLCVLSTRFAFLHTKWRGTGNLVVVVAWASFNCHRRCTCRNHCARAPGCHWKYVGLVVHCILFFFPQPSVFSQSPRTLRNVAWMSRHTQDGHCVPCSRKHTISLLLEHTWILV